MERDNDLSDDLRAEREKAERKKRPSGKGPPPHAGNSAAGGKRKAKEEDRFCNPKMEQAALGAVLRDDGVDTTPELARTRFWLLAGALGKDASLKISGDKERATFDAMSEVREEGLDLNRINVERVLKARAPDIDPKFLDELMAAPAGGVSNKALVDYGKQIRADYFKRLHFEYPAKARVIVAKEGLTPDQRTEEMRKLTESLHDDEKLSETERLVPSLENLHKEPPPRKHLVTLPDGTGVLPRGIVGMLEAMGGVGKGQALMSLTAAVTTGTPWFGERGWPTEQGRVLGAAGEEDREEMERRLHFAAVAAGLTSETDWKKIKDNFTPLPLLGKDTRICLPFDSRLSIAQRLTQRGRDIQRMIARAEEEGRPYSLVWLDPLSLFGPEDFEKDTTIATDFVQLCGYLIGLGVLKAPPTLINAHHAGKVGPNEWKPGKKFSVYLGDIARGHSSLTYGHRWTATMQTRPLLKNAPRIVDLVGAAKSNYTADALHLPLHRASKSTEGILRVATKDEVDAWEREATPPSKAPRESTAAGVTLTPEEAGEAAFDLLVQRMKAQIPLLLAKKGYSENELEPLLREKNIKFRRGKALHTACLELEEEGVIERIGGDKGKWFLVPLQRVM